MGNRKLILKKIEDLAEKYRKLWNIELCKSEDLEIFGENEYLGGKAEAFEECIKILNER